MSKQKYIILDRDGTIIIDRNYPSAPAQVELLPNAVAGLTEMRRLGFGLIVVSNQSGIGRGLITVQQAESVTNRMLYMLRAENITIERVYYCPHHPDDGCHCRKPATGLIDQAVDDLHFRPEDSFVIGDKCSDIGLAKNIGAVGILVRTGSGAQAEQSHACSPDCVADDLLDASEFIRTAMSV